MNLCNKNNLFAFTAVLLLYLVLNFTAAFMTPIVYRKESRRPEVSREMARSGKWWSPTLQGEPFFTKPPLYYWAGAAVYKVTGTEHVTAIRAVHMAATLVILAFFLVRLRKSILEGLSVCAVMLSMYMFHLHSMTTDMDMLITCFVTLTFFTLKDYLMSYKKKDLILGLMMFSAGILVKGPIIGLFTVIPLTLWFFIRQESYTFSKIGNELKKIHWGWLIVFLAIGVTPWYLYSNQSAAAVHSAMSENIGHMSHFGFFPSLCYYTWNWIFCTFPWGILMFAFFKISKKELSAEWIQLAVAFLGMSIFVKADIKYLIPIFPTAAYIVGLHARPLMQLAPKKWFRISDRFIMGVYVLILMTAIYIVAVLQNILLALCILVGVLLGGGVLWRVLPKGPLMNHSLSLMILFTIVNGYVAMYGHGTFYDHFFKSVKAKYADDAMVDINFPAYGASLNIGKIIPDSETMEDIPEGTLMLYETKDEDDSIIIENEIVYVYHVQEHFGTQRKKKFPYTLIPKYDLYLLRKGGNHALI